MKVGNRSYPHPVLASGSDDVLKAFFQAPVIPDIKNNFVELKITCQVSDKSLRDLIASGQASFVLHLECPPTRFRKEYSFNDSSLTVDIPATDVKDYIEYCLLIIAKQNFNYFNSNFHPDYEGCSFSINKGDLLAIGSTGNVEIESEYDGLRNVDSIFNVTRTQSKNNSFDVKIDQNKIQILLSDEVFEDYLVVKDDSEKSTIINSLIAIPALTMIIERIRKSDESDIEDLESNRWYRRITTKLDELGIELDNEDYSSISIAQLLIGNQFDSAFNQLKKEVESEDYE